MLETTLSGWISRSKAAERAAHAELSLHEKSVSRIIILEDLVRRVQDLPEMQAEHFFEAMTALRSDLFRAAHVLAWGGFFHSFLTVLYGSKEAEVRQARPKWTFSTTQELMELQTESAVLDAAKEVGFISRAELRVLQGYLSTRNLCAHPTGYHPSLNMTLGYVEAMISRASALHQSNK